MAGFLENPQDVGLLSLGLRLMSTPGKFGQALGTSGLGALGDLQQAQQAAQIAKQRKLQEQMLMEQQRRLQEQAEKERAAEAARAREAEILRQSVLGGQGPVNIQDFLRSGGSVESLGRVGEINQMLKPPEPPKPIVSKPGDVARHPITGEMMWQNPQEPKPQNFNDLIITGPDGKPMINQLALQAKRELARAGATSVSVNTGQNIPHQLVKQQDELIDKMTTARAIETDLAAISERIDTGKLKFGPVTNILNEGRNLAGMSTEQSRNFATFKSTLEKLRNDSLRLNNGVQTEGDAQRAWNELFQNINDQTLVRQRLTEIAAINRRAAELHSYRLNVLRQNSGAGELPAPPISPALKPAAPASGLSAAEAAELQQLRQRFGRGQ